MHPIDRFKDDGKIPYRKVRGYLYRSLAVFAAASFVTVGSGLIVFDYLIQWPVACSGAPLPSWPGVIAFFLMLGFGVVTLKKIISIATIFEPLADGTDVVDDRKPRGKTSNVFDQGVADFQAKTAKPETVGRPRETNVDRDHNVINGDDWLERSGVPT